GPARTGCVARRSRADYLARRLLPATAGWPRPRAGAGAPGMGATGTDRPGPGKAAATAQRRTWSHLRGAADTERRGGGAVLLAFHPDRAGAGGAVDGRSGVLQRGRLRARHQSARPDLDRRLRDRQRHPWPRRALGRLGWPDLHLHVEQEADRLLLDAVQHGLEHGVALALVLHHRVALGVRAQAHTLLEV